MRPFLIIGAGLVAVSGAGFGYYKLWQYLTKKKRPKIVPPGPGPTPDDDSNNGGSDNGDSPPPSPSTAARTNPPNITEDPLGYNGAMFPDFPSIHAALESFGYSVGPITTEQPTKTGVEKFQRDYTRVSNAMKAGKMKALPYFLGTLKIDGVPGDNTLRALEVLNHNIMINKLGPWSVRVQQASA